MTANEGSEMMKPNAKKDATVATAPLAPSAKTAGSSPGKVAAVPAVGEPVVAPVEPAPIALPPAADLAPAAVIADGTEGVIGQIPVKMHELPLALVLLSIGDDLSSRVVTMQSSAAIRDKASQMRVSDGQLAPAVFTQNDRGECHLFDGIDSVALAMAIGKSQVPVVIAPASSAEALQSLLNAPRALSIEDDEVLMFASYGN